MALADLIPVSFVEIGKIKIGGKGDARQGSKGGSYRMPVKYDHFIITTLFRDDKTENFVIDTPLMESLKDYADKDGKLRSLPIMFGSNVIDEVMQTSYTWYIGKSCGARTDGRTITFWNDPKTGQRLDHPKESKWDESYLEMLDPVAKNKPLLKRFTTLNCMIASPAARFGGFYRFRTTSEISSRQLFGSLMHFAGPRGLCPGTLKGLPFRLVIRPMPVAPDGKPTVVHVVHVEYMNADLKALQAAAAEQRKLELQGVEMILAEQQQYKQLLAAQKDDEPEEEIDDAVIATEEEKPADDGRPAEKAIRVIEKALREAADVEGIKTFWSGDHFRNDLWPQLDDDDRAAAVKLWKERKDELSRPAPSQEAPGSSQEATQNEPPTEESPAESQPASQGTPQKAGKAIQDALNKLCVEVGSSWNDVRARHAAEFGITCSRIADLTADQVLALVSILKKQQLEAKEQS